MKRLFSGIQPTGTLHIGNYIGAIQQWKELQKEYEAIFCIVNLHAITTPQDPQELLKNTLSVTALYLACGIDPEQSIIFIQSDVPAHTELAWILATQTPMGEMERMTQFKDKVQRGKPQNIGLFTYPILMAADILLYQSELVPVGEDQKQHVEFARDIAEKFNKKYGEPFTIPKIFQPKRGARIMGLDDPTNKMSKSAASPLNYIALTDSEDTIRNKFKKAVTDSGTDILFDEKTKPAITNLLTIYLAVTKKSEEEIEQHFQGKQYSDLKSEIAEAVIEFLKPIQQKHQELLSNPQELHTILKNGKEKANTIAQETLITVKKAMGIE